MFKEKLREFLTGRYGGDSLNTALGILSLLSFVAATIVTAAVKGTVGIIIGAALYIVALGAVALSVFRVFSKDLTARRAEYEWFRKHVIAPFKKLFGKKSSAPRADKDHKLFKCPKCGQTVRVPKGKGKIRITCPKCGEAFVKKT